MLQLIKPEPSENHKILAFIERYALLLLLPVLLTAAFNCFYLLESTAVQDWDEARHGVSAYEMGVSGNYLANTYQFQTDYWNLKPPLSFWAIALSNQVFQSPIFSMRFYSALSFLLTVLFIALFVRQRYGGLEALICGSLTACCPLFYALHFARNGDTDALFSLFLTVCMMFMLTLKEKPGNVWIVGLAFSLAFLAKSWHALLAVCIGGVYFFTAKLYRFIRLKHWAVLLACGLGPPLLWAAARYSYDGWAFLAEMVRVDLFNRVTQTLENHAGGALYYLSLVFGNSKIAGFLFAAMLAYLLLAHIVSRKMGASNLFFRHSTMLRQDLSGYLLWITIPFILLSTAQTKLDWYIFPFIFPILILTGLLIAQVFKRGSESVAEKTILAMVLAVVLIADTNTTAVMRHSPENQPTAFQTFITEGLSATGIRGGDVYSDAEWTQSRIFLSESHMDFRCREGGIEGFSAAPSGYLILEKFSLSDPRLKNYPVIYEGYGLTCLKKD